MRVGVYLLILMFSFQMYGHNIGLLIVATGRYIQFVESLINSADKYFCKNHKVTYFIFTDGQPPKRNDVVKVDHQRLGWPHDTLRRFTVYHKNKELFKNMDYLFATDADMLFVDDVGDEILSDRVATQHPGFVGRRGTYETRPISSACVRSNEGKIYFAGGFNGGSRDEFLRMAETISRNIDQDLNKNFIALWHDESHLNRYFIDNPPTCVLNPSYCYPESWRLPYPKKLLALDKNHSALRG